jgi:hypothetical protein
VLEICTGACTHTFEPATVAQPVLPPWHARTVGDDDSAWIFVGSSLDASKEVFTAVTALLAGVLTLLHVTQYGAAAARAPSSAARVIAP